MLRRRGSKWLVAAVLVLGAAAIVWATFSQPRVSGLAVAPGGDYTLTVTNPPLYGPATIQPGLVTSFHLDQPPNANGKRIINSGTGTASGDGVVYGQAVATGHFTGSLPNPTLRFPTLYSSFSMGGTVLGAGACDEATATVFGAQPGMAASAAPTSDLGQNVMYAAYIPGVDQVTVRECVVYAQTTPVTTFALAVIQ